VSKYSEVLTDLVLAQKQPLDSLAFLDSLVSLEAALALKLFLLVVAQALLFPAQKSSLLVLDLALVPPLGP
jgi:hypothetical protein